MLPVSKPVFSKGKYDIYPGLKINDNQIFTGFEALAERIKDYKNISIDGYNGAFFDLFQVQPERITHKRGPISFVD